MSNRLPVISRPVRVLAALVWLAVLVADPPPALAQANFTVTFQVERTGPTHVELVGRVYNGASADVVDVHVTAEARDGAGKVLARGIAFVASMIPARSGAEFSARVPARPGTVGYRVTVSSFRYGLGRGESP